MASRNTKRADWYGAHHAAIMNEVVGDVFYVHGSTGANTNDGLTPYTPFLTISHAMDQCTAWADDYIFVLSYPEMAATEVWPIAMDVDKVHLIGTTKQASPSPVIRNNAGVSVAITGHNCEIAGFGFGSQDGAAACISIDGDLWQVHIHHNDFGRTTYGGLDGILISGAYQTVNCYFHHNHFDTGCVDGIHGIAQQGRMIISDNFFRCIAGIGINLAGGGYDCVVRDNRFKVADSANGEAITMGLTGTTTSYFDGNRAAEGTAALANNPFRELGANHWGLNYAGLTPTYPVLV